MTNFNRFSEISAHFFVGGTEGSGTQEVVEESAVPTFGEVAYPTNDAVRNSLSLRLNWFDEGSTEYARLLPHFDALVEMVSTEIE